MAMFKEMFRKLTLKLAILLFCTNLGIFIYQTTEQRISIARMNVHLSAGKESLYLMNGTKLSEVSGIETVTIVRTDSPVIEIIPHMKTDSPVIEIDPTEKAETNPIDTFPSVRVEDVSTDIFSADKQQIESEGKKNLTNFTRLKEAEQSVKFVQLNSSFGNPRSSLEHSNKRVTTQLPLLVLFTTWVSRDYNRQIHDNVLRTWRLNHPFIVPMLFSQEPNERNRARSYGWWGLSLPETACGGVPILREMFRVALKMYPFALLYGFSNGDLLLGSGLLDTMRDLAGERFLSERPVLLILRRFNLDFTNRSDVHDLRNVEEMRAQATEVTDGSSDAFFTNHLFPWHYIPNIVPGRLGVAMWLVAAARSLNITVIDITPTVTAVHMTSQAGNLEAHRHAQKMCNRKLLNVLKVEPPSWKCGSILCAPWISVPPLSESNQIRFLPKQVANISTSHSCDNCTIDLKSLYRQIQVR